MPVNIHTPLLSPSLDAVSLRVAAGLLAREMFSRLFGARPVGKLSRGELIGSLVSLAGLARGFVYERITRRRYTGQRVRKTMRKVRFIAPYRLHLLWGEVES